MKFLNDLLEKLYPPVKPLQPGLYSYRPEKDDDFPFSMHLRIETPEHAILILHAKTVLHLNQTAAEFLYDFIQHMSRDRTIKALSKRYAVAKATIASDYDDLFERLQVLMTTPDLDPVSFLDFERQVPYSGEIAAPYRLDLALTYRFSEGSEVESELQKRITQELSEEEWLRVVEKSWEIGVPHLIFTGGEPTLQPYLPKLLAAAETHGQVTGILTDGVKLTDRDYMNLLLNQGLDHIVLVLDPDQDACWEAVANLLPEDIHVTVHLTINQTDTDYYQNLLENLQNQQVSNISLSARTKDMQQTLDEVNEIALDLGFSITYDIPVPYSHYNPVELELEAEEVKEVGNAWLYIEPDGD
ncbi:MAG TPA: radical SAM protein, partial [Chloroflexi bacterium]|nr:radical SAM protein [Chloroflexota bacterium]